jgi:hypothetical protein
LIMLDVWLLLLYRPGWLALVEMFGSCCCVVLDVFEQFCL